MTDRPSEPDPQADRTVLAFIRKMRGLVSSSFGGEEQPSAAQEREASFSPELDKIILGRGKEIRLKRADLALEKKIRHQVKAALQTSEAEREAAYDQSAPERVKIRRCRYKQLQKEIAFRRLGIQLLRYLVLLGLLFAVVQAFTAPDSISVWWGWSAVVLFVIFLGLGRILPPEIDERQVKYYERLMGLLP